MPTRCAGNADGRAVEVGQVGQVEALDGRATLRVVLVRARGGMGKTRLLKETPRPARRGRQVEAHAGHAAAVVERRAVARLE